MKKNEIYSSKLYRIRRAGQSMQVQDFELRVGDLISSQGRWQEILFVQGTNYYLTST